MDPKVHNWKNKFHSYLDISFILCNKNRTDCYLRNFLNYLTDFLINKKIEITEICQEMIYTCWLEKGLAASENLIFKNMILLILKPKEKLIDVYFVVIVLHIIIIAKRVKWWILIWKNCWWWWIGNWWEEKEEQWKLTTLEQQNGNLSQVEVDEVACLVRYIRSKVSSDDTMPCWVVFFVEFLLNVCGNVLL